LSESKRWGEGVKLECWEGARGEKSLSQQKGGRILGIRSEKLNQHPSSTPENGLKEGSSTIMKTAKKNGVLRGRGKVTHNLMKRVGGGDWGEIFPITGEDHIPKTSGGPAPEGGGGDPRKQRRVL